MTDCMKNRPSDFGPFNCIAIERRQRIFQLFQSFYPPIPLFSTANCQFQSRFALRVAPYPSPTKQTPPQSLQLYFLQQSQFPLQQHAKVISPDGKLAHGLSRPKILTEESFYPKVALNPHRPFSHSRP